MTKLPSTRVALLAAAAAFAALAASAPRIAWGVVAPPPNRPTPSSPLASRTSRPTSPTRQPSVLARARPRAQRLDDDVDRARALHDPAGLALFYGGLVRRKNVLSVMAQCLGCAGLVTILWWAFGYSLAFAPGLAVPRRHEVRVPRRASAPRRTRDYAYWVSQNVFAMYQLMFAIITPALIVGAIAERMKYSAIMVFIARAGCSSSTSRSPTWSGASTA